MVGFRAMLFVWIYAALIDTVLRDIRACTPGFAGMKAGDRVLDVCCGTGDQALYYAGMGIDASGIDDDFHMIAWAQKNRRRRSLDDASFQVADAERLPFKDKTFDCVSISFALHDKGSVSRDKIIAEMKRVVKDEGALLFMDFAVPLPRNPYGLVIRIVEFFAGWNHFQCSRDYIRRGGLDVLLKRHGLREDKRDYLKHGTMAIIKATTCETKQGQCTSSTQEYSQNRESLDTQV
jgi:ubiquinone/menaquinone biosynthesis C-methylase UbiE